MFLADAFKRSLSAQSAFVIIGFSFVVCLIGCWATFVLSSRQIEQHTLAQERAYMGERLQIARAIFERIEEAHAAANRRFISLSEALSEEDVEATFERVFELRDDGTRRLGDEFFYGATIERMPVFGMAAFVAPGEMNAERRRTLVAAYEAIRDIGPAHSGALESLWFFTPTNDLIIFAPDRLDRLSFYRHEAPADFDFQSTGFARLVAPENNPDGVMRCTDL